jgi:putative pyruvate formate lyase activating enzyme
VAAEELADIMLSLAEAGALNINLVSPTPYVPVIARALVRAKKQGLALPVVYNTGGYDSLRALAIMEGLADIYLPDAKIGRDPLLAEGDPDSRSMRLLGAGDYTAVNRLALKEMLRQTGHLVLDQDGIARKGLLVRHLVLPDDLARTSELLPWLAENLGRQVCLSLMAQYHPNNRLRQGGDPELRAFPGLTRPLSIREYELAAEQAWNLGLENTFVQDPSSSGTYIPDFSRPKVFS